MLEIGGKSTKGVEKHGGLVFSSEIDRKKTTGGGETAAGGGRQRRWFFFRALFGKKTQLPCFSTPIDDFPPISSIFRPLLRFSGDF